MRSPGPFLAAIVAVALAAVLPAPAAPNPASSAFIRAANTPAGRAAIEAPAATQIPAGGEKWTVAGQDLLPFYFEQGVAYTHASGLVFSSRGSLTRTALGCAAPLDPVQPCYDVAEENVGAIPGAERQLGFNHIGDIDVGRAGPAAGFVFGPLETDPPRHVRGYMAYDLATLTPKGKIIETVDHGYNSWVTVDPSGHWLLTAENTMNPIRVYEIASAGAGQVSIIRRDDLDITIPNPPSPPLPNMAGCAFPDATGTTLYCANWAKRSSYFDVNTEVYRIDLSAAAGQPGATVSSSRIVFTLKLQPKNVVTANTPYGLETEGLTFYERGGRQEMHILLRGETLGWFHFVHLAPEA